MIQEGSPNNAGSFLRKELGEALRIGPKMQERGGRPDAPILRHLRRLINCGGAATTTLSPKGCQTLEP